MNRETMLALVPAIYKLGKEGYLIFRPILVEAVADTETSIDDTVVMVLDLLLGVK